MKRYDIDIEYDFYSNRPGVEQDPEGDWVKFDEAQQRIAELEAHIESMNAAIADVRESPSGHKRSVAWLVLNSVQNKYTEQLTEESK